MSFKLKVSRLQTQVETMFTEEKRYTPVQVCVWIRRSRWKKHCRNKKKTKTEKVRD